MGNQDFRNVTAKPLGNALGFSESRAKSRYKEVKGFLAFPPETSEVDLSLVLKHFARGGGTVPSRLLQRNFDPANLIRPKDHPRPRAESLQHDAAEGSLLAR